MTNKLRVLYNQQNVASHTPNKLPLHCKQQTVSSSHFSVRGYNDVSWTMENADKKSKHP